MQVTDNTYKILIFKKSSYRIINELGKGGSGKVQKLQKDKNYYALKTINIEKLEEKNINYCKEEIETLKSFDSKYIIKFYGSQIEEKNFKILMEYGGDTNLKTFIEKYKTEGKFIFTNKEARALVS
jgi:serine/threonine protein kinase